MPRLRTILFALLGASLAVNAVLGFMLLSAPGQQPQPRRGFDRMVARIENSLPEADRPRFRAVLDRERGRYDAPLGALRAAGRDVDRLMAQEPFDAAALRDGLGAWSDRWVAFTAAFNDVLVEALREVSPEGRARIAEARRPRD